MTSIKKFDDKLLYRPVFVHSIKPLDNTMINGTYTVYVCYNNGNGKKEDEFLNVKVKDHDNGHDTPFHFESVEEYFEFIEYLIGWGVQKY